MSPNAKRSKRTSSKDDTILSQEVTKIEITPERLSKFFTEQQIADEKVFFDFTKTHITIDEYQKISDELEEKDLLSEVKKMFEGGKTNFTEDRSVMHTALRHKDVLDCLEKEMDTECTNDLKFICDEFKKIKEFTEKFEKGELKGASGKILNKLVNIGIGGSDLGPRFVCEALDFYKLQDKKAFFVSNVDALELDNVLSMVDVEETLFIIVSKTFTTQETLANARLALKMVSEKTGKSENEISDLQFVAVSSNIEEVEKFGIKNVFAMWDFVGGRYSLWSAVGISISLFLGFKNFLKLLRGASIVDEDFRNDPLNSAPLMHAILEIFYGRSGYPTKCIVPYDYYLRNFYLHIQQLDMESNGKSATRTAYSKEQTGMVVWGGVGTNSQHSFFQLLHQGTHKVLSEFLLPIKPIKEFKTSGATHHEMVVANCLAQTEALMNGKKSENPHKNFEGNKPSLTFAYTRLCPETLGALIAHYEHKVFVGGLCWEINSFDQFGVQLGKEIANKILDSVQSGDSDIFSASTVKILKEIRK